MPTPSKPSLNTTESHVAPPSAAFATPSPLPSGTVPQVGPSPAAVATGSASPQASGYEVLGELGRGGMGVVYLAKNVLMDRREVLKVVNKALLDRPGVMERFLREIRSAAMLNHNNVVKAYSAVQAGELIIFAMEYVEGEDLHKVVQRQGPLPIPYACHYVSQAALGLQHAHEHHMVHRDIKPHNLILSRQGKKHIVKVLDFGLAKAKREGEAVADLTGEGAMMGTPAYMAPEQARDAASADIRADVYSLGCTLYFLLTGAPPFAGRSFFEILQAHVATEAKPLHQSRPEAPAELAAVVAKMMAKDPAQRYQKPIEAARALTVFIKTQAPAAKPPATAAPKAVKTETKTVSGSGSSVLPIAGLAPRPPGGASVATTTGKTAPPRARPVAKKRSLKWVIGGAAAVALLIAAGGIWLGVSAALRGTTPNGKQAADSSPPAASGPDKTGDPSMAPDLRSASDYDLTGGHRFVHFGADGPRVVLGDGDQSFARVYDLTTGLAVTPPHDGSFPDPCFSSDGRWVVTVDLNTDVWSAATGGSLSPPAKPVDLGNPLNGPGALPDDYLTFATFSPDGKRTLETYGLPGSGLGGLGGLGALGGGIGGLGALGALGTPPGGPGVPPGGALGSPGSAPPGGGPGGFGTLGGPPPGGGQLGGPFTGVPAPGGNPVGPGAGALGGPPPGGGIPGPGKPGAGPGGKPSPAPGGKPGAGPGGGMPGAGGKPGAMKGKTPKGKALVCSAATGKPLTAPMEHDGSVVYGMFSPDGRRVVTASDDGTARVWDAANGKPLSPFLQHGNAVRHAAFSPDGKRVVTASDDKTARVWDAVSGEPLCPSLNHDDVVNHAAFSPDGKRVVTASADKTARVWDTATGQPITPPLPHDDAVSWAVFSPDGKKVATASADKTARVWDAATGQPITSPLQHDDAVEHVAFSPDGGQVVTQSRDHTARLWDATTGEELKKATIAKE